MANSISISNAQNFPDGQFIRPEDTLGPTDPGFPVANPPTDSVEDPDDISISATGGIGAVDNYSVLAGGGDDTLTFNGSVFRASVDMGDGEDLFRVNTLGNGGSLTESTIRGGDGNDVFQLIEGVSVETTSLRGGEGSDLFELEGGFNKVSILGGAGEDVVSFLGGAGSNNFRSSFVALGADDDLFTDGGFPLDASASSVNGGGGSDTINFSGSDAGVNGNGLSITGGEADDYLYGSNGENTIRGGAGNDFIQSFDGDDYLVGGGLSDTIVLGDGNDLVEAGDGNDLVWGQDGQNTIDAGLGSDIVIGGLDDDSIFGGSGQFRDYLVGNEGDDTIDGGSGDDLIYGDDVDPGSAADFANYGSFRILGRNEVTEKPLTGLVENASLEDLTEYFADGETSFNIDWLGVSDEEVADEDFFKAAFAPDVSPWNGATRDEEGAILADNPGGVLIELDDEQNLTNTLIVPGSEAVYIPGYGDNENDLFDIDDAGDDVLIGNSGNDTIFGGAGDDEIFGGLGNDVIIGGEDSDTMSGGDGSDIFVQGIGSSSEDLEAVFNGGNWTFTWDEAMPDFITDFTATDNNNNVVDRVAFQGGVNFITPGDWESANTDTHDVVIATGSANLAEWDSGEIIVFRGDWNGSSFTTSNTGDDILAFGARFGRDTTDGFDTSDIGSQAVILLDAGDQTFRAANFFGVLASSGNT